MSMTDNGGELDGHTPLTAEEQAAWDAMQGETDFDPGESGDGGDQGAGEGDGGSDAGDGAALDAGAGGSEGAEGGTPQQQQARQQQRTEEDDEADGVETSQGKDGKPQKRVSFHKYQRLEQAFEQTRRDLETTKRDQAAREARLEERLAIINEALATPQQAQQQQDAEDADPAPDPEKEIFEYVKWQQRRIERQEAAISEMRDAETGRAEANTLLRTYQESAAEFASTEPNFAPAYTFLVRQREAELIAQGTKPSEVREKITREEQGLVRKAVSEGKNPAEYVFSLAKVRGFQPMTAEQMTAARQQAAQRANGGTVAPKPAPKQADPGALDAPLDASQRRAPVQRQQQNGNGRQPARQQEAPLDVRAIVDGINRGQDAARSLSNAGGSVPPTLTAKAVADMSESDFALLVDNLPEERLREVFGD